MRRADIEVPNHPVDMDSWEDQPVIPWGTFYPLSDTTSTVGAGSLVLTFVPARHVRLTVKLPCALCTQHLISNQAEGTFGAPPLHFREATAPVKLPTRHCP